MKIAKRLAAGLCAALLLASPLLSPRAAAAGDGYWERTDHIVTEAYTDYLPAMHGIAGRDEPTDLTRSGSNGSYRMDWESKSRSDSVTAHVSIPGERYRPGDSISLSMSLLDDTSETQYLKCYPMPGAARGGAVSSEEPSPTNPYGFHKAEPIIGNGRDEALDAFSAAIGNEYDYVTQTTLHHGYGSKTFRMTVPDGAETSYNQFCIIADFSGDFYEGWTYTWRGGAAGTPQSGGTQHVVITNPPDRPGEFGGDTPIIAVIITGVGGAAAAAGAIGGRRRREDGDEEEEDRPSTFRMMLNKNFGNSLKKGNPPQAVYARIIETKWTGEEVERHDLTAMIQVSSYDNSLIVTDGGIVNDYKCAMASVPEDSADANGVVTFSLSTPTGSFLQSVVFRLTEAEIVFAQENMGLPANRLKYAQEETGLEEGQNARFGDGEFRIHFLVKGMGSQPDVFPAPRVRVTGALERTGVTDATGEVRQLPPEKYGMPYSLDLHPDSKDADKGIFEAVIREVLDYELPAGTTEGFALHITAEHGVPGEQDYEKLEGFFPIYRIHLGLAMSLEASHIGCHMQLREFRRNLKKEEIKPSDLEPCFTEGSCLLYLYRRKDLSIIRVPVAPEREVKVTVKRVANDRYCHIGDADESHQEMVDALGIQAFPAKDLRENGALRIRVSCTKAALDPPIRFIADLEFTVKYKSKVFTYQKENVLLHSQPFREPKSVDEEMKLLQEDSHIAERLERIRNSILERDYMNRLAALYNLCNRMLDGYDSRFGYDKNQVENVMRIWTGFLDGSHAGANGDTISVTWADELEACYAFMQGLRDNTGILGHIAMGIMTAGYSEYVFTTMTLAEEMRDKVFACHGDEFGFWDGVIMGVKEFEKQILIEYAMMGAGKALTMNITPMMRDHLANQLTRLGTRYRAGMRAADRWMNQNSAAYRLANDGFKGCKNFYNSSARALRNAINKVEQEMKDALAQTEKNAAQVKTRLTPEERELLKEYQKAMDKGMEKVRRLEDTQREMERALPADKAAAIQKYKEAANEVWADKNALKQLQLYKDPYAARMRAQYSHYHETACDRAQQGAIKDLASDYHIPEDELYCGNASSGSRADYYSGKKAPNDRDITISRKVRSDRSKDFAIGQDEAERAIARRLFKELKGYEADTIEEAVAFMKEMDVTYVAPQGNSFRNYVIEPNLEAYTDLPGMIDRSRFGTELKGLGMNQATMAYKGKEWFNQSKECLAKAAELEARAASLSGAARDAALNEAKALRYASYGKKVEGIRQITKQVENIAIPRRCALCKEGEVIIPKDLLKLHNQALRVGTELSPVEFENILRVEYNMSLNDYADRMSELLR
ncbi:MAG: hypothetical protein E7474_11585 [Ruminococcaceae bacterium]|nr:hypothetical protein [Oscillospiraceae bacterium]